MTNLEALNELAAKVEAGDLQQLNIHLGQMFSVDQDLPWDWISNVNSAFQGSRDAADALRKAVLPPDFIMSSDNTGFAHVWRDEYEVTHNWSALIPGNQARAELLAILRALIAMEDGK